jgi:hypothetical protein
MPDAWREIYRSSQGQQECLETWELLGQRAGAAAGDEISSTMALAAFFARKNLNLIAPFFCNSRKMSNQRKGLLEKIREQKMTTFRLKSRSTKVLSKYARTGWTPERRFVHAVAIQRWRPWERSTGPKGAEGKAKSAENGKWSRPWARVMKLSSKEFLRFFKRAF